MRFCSKCSRAVVALVAALALPVSHSVALLIVLVGATSPAWGATLIGHWAFEEGTGSIAFDSSPNHLDGHIYNATYTNVTDPTHPALGTYALDFNGSNSYVEVGDNDLLEPATIGISLWFKCDSRAGYHDLLDKGHGTSPYYSGYVVQGLDDTGLAPMYGNGSGFPGLTEHFGVYDGNWHHLVANLGQDAIEVYVDNMPVAGGGPGAGPIVTNDSDLFFGRHSVLGRYYHGLIADIELYAVPEPATLSLLALGGVGILLGRRRK